MRILMVVHKLPPESLGGTEIYTRSLARVLSAQGHTVTLFAPTSRLSQPALILDSDGVLLYHVPRPPSRAIENPAALYWHTFRDFDVEAHFAECLARTTPDVVHFQHVQGVSAQLIDQARGRPRVMTLHDYWYFCANSQLIRPDRSPCAGPSWANMNCVDCATQRADLAPLRHLRPLVAMPFAYRNHYLREQLAGIDRFVAPSHFLRDQYVGQGFAGDRIDVLENGMDAERLRVASSAPDASRESGEGPRPRVGFLGTLAWQKGVHVLVEAFNRLPSEVGSLTIYGSGDAFPEYAEEVRRAIRHPRVHLAGPAPYDEVGNVLRGLDVLVVSSLWYENSPLVIQEARAAGVPVIASDLGALAEKVQDGVDGRLFPPGDSAALADRLLEIAHAPELLARWAANLTPPPTMTEHAALLVSIYEQLLHNLPSKP